MSLTRELKNPQSPASRFMRDHFPMTRRVMALCRGQMGSEFETYRPEQPVPWSLIGTALDYRLRFYFPQVGRRGQIEKLVCFQGAAIACGTTRKGISVRGNHDFLSPELMSEFFSTLKQLLDQTQPQQSRLDKSNEEALLRYCVVMAALDFFFRVGYDSGSVLLIPAPKVTLNELLSVAEAHWIDDLRVLSWQFYDKFSKMLSCPAILNPTFDGSGFIGGADADLIIDGCLVDIKTTVNPMKENWIYQLLGYVLLDWHDEYKIKEVAVYFARQAFLLKWNLNDILRELTGQPQPSLAQLRQGWHDVIGKPYFGTSELSEIIAKDNGYEMIDGRWRRITEQN